MPYFFKITLEDCRGEAKEPNAQDWLALLDMDMEVPKNMEGIEPPSAYGKTPEEALKNIAKDIGEYIAKLESREQNT